MRRERTYSDQRVIDFISEHFVPAAVNINHLQRQEDEEGTFFRTISWQGRYEYSFEEAVAAAPDSDHGECHQGQYVASIEGELFGTRHTADPDVLLSMMASAVENWQSRKTQRVKESVGTIERDARHVWSFPEDGLVLEVGCRDLSSEVDQPAEWRFDAHNVNHVWMTADEVRAFVPSEIGVGDAIPIPELVHRRLVRFHFLDIVRGETPPWPADAPEGVPLTTVCTAIDEDRVFLDLIGDGLLVEAGDWCGQPPRASVYRGREQMCCQIGERGFEPHVLGKLVYNRTKGRFERFDVVVVGTRWGGTTFNFRQHDVEPDRLGIVMTIAGSDERDKTPPAGSPGRYFSA